MESLCPYCKTEIIKTVKQKSKLIDFVEYNLPVNCYKCDNENCPEDFFFDIEDLIHFDTLIAIELVTVAIDDYTKRSPSKFKFARQALALKREELYKLLNHDVYVWETGEEEIPEYAWKVLKQKLLEKQ